MQQLDAGDAQEKEVELKEESYLLMGTTHSQTFLPKNLKNQLLNNHIWYWSASTKYLLSFGDLLYVEIIINS